jgi:hypothetical protein
VAAQALLFGDRNAGEPAPIQELKSVNTSTGHGSLRPPAERTSLTSTLTSSRSRRVSLVTSIGTDTQFSAMRVHDDVGILDAALAPAVIVPAAAV